LPIIKLSPTAALSRGSRLAYIPITNQKPRRATLTLKVYKPPQSDLLSETEVRPNKFYVVSKLKLTVLFLATLGLYIIYWFYINWTNYRDTAGEKIMPVPRSIFYIFFTHSLFNKVDADLKFKQIEYDWSPKTMATLFVIVSIASSVLDRLSFREYGSPLIDILSIAILPIALLIILKAQEAINLSQNDRDGSSNSKFTVYNYLWIALGLVFWILITVGMIEMFGLISIES
jgi:hypothetical protein